MQKGKIKVLGSASMTAVVEIDRMPGPGEQVVGRRMLMTPGGKGSNQAIAASRLGGDVELYCKMGNDYFRNELVGLLKKEGVKLVELRRSMMHTGTGIIMVEPTGRNTIISVRGSNNDIKDLDIKRVRLHNGDIAVSQLSVTHSAVIKFFKKAKQARCTTILNCAPRVECSSALLDMADYLIFNEFELMHFGGVTFMNHETEKILDAANQLRSKNQVVIATLGADGLLAVGPFGNIRLKAHKVKAVDTTGAGDCFVGAFAFAMSNGKDINYALKFANAAAAISVTELGATTAFPNSAMVKSLMQTRI